MAAATVASQSLGNVMGNKRVSFATLTSPADTNTWESGLRLVEGVYCSIIEASGSASDAISPASISGGTITLDVQGTVDSAFITAFGV